MPSVEETVGRRGPRVCDGDYREEVDLEQFRSAPRTGLNRLWQGYNAGKRLHGPSAAVVFPPAPSGSEEAPLQKEVDHGRF